MHLGLGFLVKSCLSKQFNGFPPIFFRPNFKWIFMGLNSDVHVREVSSFQCKANSMMKAVQPNITFKNPAEIIVSTMRYAVGLKGHLYRKSNLYNILATLRLNFICISWIPHNVIPVF